MNKKRQIFIIIFYMYCGLCKLDECIPKKYNFDTVVCVCNSTYCDKIKRPSNLTENEYIIYTSSQNGQRFQMEKGFFQKTAHGNRFVNRISTNATKTYQSIIGFGGAFTDSAGITINSLTKSAKKFLLKSYFGEDGIEYTLGRVPIGGTDFSKRKYTYDDGHSDPKLKNFTLAYEDYVYKIPLIKDAISLSNHTLKLFGTAWTAPQWMLNTGSFMRPNQLLKTMYQPWAEYHIKFLKAYQMKEINFWGITTGNDAASGLLRNFNNVVGWQPNELSSWIVDYLGPLLHGSEFSALKLMTVEDNIVNFPFYIDKMIAADKNVEKYVDGFALHWYLNSRISYPLLSLTHNKYPSKFILATEACPGVQAGSSYAFHPRHPMGSWERAENFAYDIIKDLRNWVTGWVDWNIALDMTGGPNYKNNSVDSPIIVNATSSEFYKQPLYYILGHFSKFIPRKSQRIDIIQSVNNLEVVAFRKPNGDKVAVLLNMNRISVMVHFVNAHGKSVRKSIPAKSITTILYQ